jgi:hypothetical protein
VAARRVAAACWLAGCIERRRAVDRVAQTTSPWAARGSTAAHNTQHPEAEAEAEAASAERVARSRSESAGRASISNCAAIREPREPTNRQRTHTSGGRRPRNLT